MTAISVRERLRPYIADALEGRVLRLPAGSTTPTELSFTDLHKPWSVAVDSAGSVYVIDVNSDIGMGVGVDMRWAILPRRGRHRSS